MTTLHDPTSTATDDYRRGWNDATEQFTRRHLHRIADVLDAIDQHAGNPELLCRDILTALGHATP